MRHFPTTLLSIPNYKIFQYAGGRRFFGVRARELPHDDMHQFLDWGERDEVLRLWIEHFNRKSIPFDLVEEKNGVSIFKHHMEYALLPDKTYTATRCCP